jgi:hypothetical protein
LPTLPPTTEGTVFPNDKVNELHDDGNSTMVTPTNAEESSTSSTEAEVNITPQPTRSPTAATDTAVAPDLSKCTSVDEWIVGGNSQYGGLTCVIV